ncbi:MAG: VOC family protein [Bacillota bacterium]
MKTVLTHVRINVSDVIKAANWYVEVWVRLNFQVPNLEKLWDFLKDKAAVVEELHTTPYGVTKFTIADPDGNELGFTN